MKPRRKRKEKFVKKEENAENWTAKAIIHEVSLATPWMSLDCCSAGRRFEPSTAYHISPSLPDSLRFQREAAFCHTRRVTSRWERNISEYHRVNNCHPLLSNRDRWISLKPSQSGDGIPQRAKQQERTQNPICRPRMIHCSNRNEKFCYMAELPRTETTKTSAYYYLHQL